jgi:hypothetical protein
MKEDTIPMRKCKVANSVKPALRRSMPTAPRPPTPFAAVKTRRQTPEEERRFNAAFDHFLAELVRQHLDPHGTS